MAPQSGNQLDSRLYTNHPFQSTIVARPKVNDVSRQWMLENNSGEKLRYILMLANT